jgi:hypothetical protein
MVMVAGELIEALEASAQAERSDSAGAAVAAEAAASALIVVVALIVVTLAVVSSFSTSSAQTILRDASPDGTRRVPTRFSCNDSSARSRAVIGP